MAEPDPILLFTGSGSRRLSARIADQLGIELGLSETRRFSDGNLFVKVQQNVRGHDIFLVQSTVFPSNDNFMELLFWIDAFKRASARNVTVVIPYFSYGKGDKKDEPRVSIRARVCADAIEVAGADRVVAMDLHAPQIQGFFRVPVDNLYAISVLCDRIAEEGREELVMVSPDAGFAREARRYATALGAGVAIADKQRKEHEELAEVWDVVGEVSGKHTVIVDDFVISAGTLVSCADELMERGARSVFAAVTHGVFTPGSMERLDHSPIEKLIVTDTVENQPVELSEKVEVVSVAPLFAEAIERIHNRESISVMFGEA
ncbi:MAG TPA: ribose-phosphate pyrophosphokinase [Acidimicrobiia bacterium]|nr:ribose-phosphate pyrophosphokinase [Acidimicrobiia bacterium]